MCFFTGVFFNKILNALLEIALLFMIVLLFVHIVQAYHDMHKNGGWDGLLDQAQQSLTILHQLRRVLWAYEIG